eukprot:Plantae.Rhodophyta-Purpureofilum_apyrenoidigerum.ctg22405.p1 GENE.Plantae.Rhodophyta-Purpureofilum_apyrenoidigerum.ctg22405~~Plantae.Rhodophyta-Purpureofilum_apyrenoidigerum.ctg22405.p1  ORF type:complete len:327 (+),score=46.96 Plantae.Rhodophyta-Purpureofilum_apyrenoidigerum.ctg22405:150-1130(+)
MARIVTYSKSRTIVPTFECFNRCAYCTFRVDAPAKYISESSLQRQLDCAVEEGTKELLVLSGEVHPRSRRRSSWFQTILHVCRSAMDRGLLPHTNAGPLLEEEMRKLRDVNASMGLMLEQLTDKLMDGVHKYAPSKIPELRMEQLRMAGRLQIPFTTGLLLGIGEDEEDWKRSLEAIRDVHLEYAHVQECIIQPFSPGEERPAPKGAQKLQAFPLEKLPSAVRLARSILPPSISVQVPPNLIKSGGELLLVECVEGGATDLGGISPKDEVNPKYDFPSIEFIKNALQKHKIDLRERLALYRRYDQWLTNQRLKETVERFRAADSCL